MTTPNALGFFFLGLVMGCLPLVAPGYFPSNEMVGANTSGIWLQVMGAVNALLGLTHLSRQAPAAWRRMRALRLPAAGTYVPAAILRPALARSVRNLGPKFPAPANRRVAA